MKKGNDLQYFFSAFCHTGFFLQKKLTQYFGSTVVVLAVLNSLQK